MAKRELPSPEVLRQLLRYEPDTGKLFWLPREPHLFPDTPRRNNACAIWNSNYAGKEAGTRSHDYVRLALLGQSVLAHRIAWCMSYGKWPLFLDHINGDPYDNRLQNLREATLAENNRNLSIRRANTSGYAGVCKTREGRWRAYITHNGKQVSLGVYQDVQSAAKARKRAEADFGYHPNHGRVKTIPSIA